MRRFALSMASAGLLAGCVAGPPPVPPAGTQFDGLYAGTSTLVRGFGYPCGNPDLPTEVVVQGGRFAYPFQVDPPRTVPVLVQIAVDGSLHGGTDYGVFAPGLRRDYLIATMNVDGRIVGGTLEMTEWDYRCARRSTLQRR